MWGGVIVVGDEYEYNEDGEDGDEDESVCGEPLLEGG